MTEPTAKERTDELIAQCAMWCRLSGAQPLYVPAGGSLEYSWLLMVVHQTSLGFAALNARQRRLIAGLERG